MKQHINKYIEQLNSVLKSFDWEPVEHLAEVLFNSVVSGKKVFLCGNGGSAGNAMHLANDFLYGISPDGKALQVEALPSNSAVITCLGNDIGYENIFSHQLKVKAQRDDVLIVLSGSGNSPNIVNALAEANDLGVTSVALLGFSGGKAKELANIVIHFEVDDMQISEDTQLIVGHMLMQYLNEKLDCKKGRKQ